MNEVAVVTKTIFYQTKKKREKKPNCGLEFVQIEFMQLA